MILDKIPALDDCMAFESTPGSLTAIHQPSCAATVRQRKPLPRFQDWIDRLPPDQLPKARMILRPEAVCDALIEICRQRGRPDCSERNLFDRRSLGAGIRFCKRYEQRKSEVEI